MRIIKSKPSIERSRRAHHKRDRIECPLDETSRAIADRASPVEHDGVCAGHPSIDHGTRARRRVNQTFALHHHSEGQSINDYRVLADKLSTPVTEWLETTMETPEG